MIATYYNRLAPHYKHLFLDWNTSVDRQATVLDEVIREFFGASARRVLDAACGIGTQCLGLAQLGYEVAASDISEMEIEHAKAEAAQRGLAITFGVADMRRLREHHAQTFDLVIACDNAWAKPLRYFMSKADGKAFNAFMTALFASDVSRELNQTQQDLLQSLVREAPEKPTEALIACLHDETKNTNQQRYALDCLKTIAGEAVREYLEFYANTNTGNTDTLAYAREIAASLAAPEVIVPRKTARLELFVELPRTFHNAVEYNAEYILIPGGTIKYSVTNKIEKAPDLYFAKYPVTNKQYRRFIRYLRGEESELNKLVSPKVFVKKLWEFVAKDQAYADYLSRDAKAWPEKLKSEEDENRRFNGEEQPVVGVSWYAARAYCSWLSEMQPTPSNEQPAFYRLPQEVEWERAAAGRREDGPSRKYPWPKEKGEPNDKLANYGRTVEQTTPVGRYPEGATPEGLLDMAGNVWEWQENWHDKDKDARSLRGGSWDNFAVILPCAIRYRIYPDSWSDYVGFRVARAQSCF